MQVEDELRQVLDRVDVVVRRRADERHARLGPPHARNVRRHLAWIINSLREGERGEGGGLMRGTPGLDRRTPAMYGDT